jgi:hypothetical protein
MRNTLRLFAPVSSSLRARSLPARKVRKPPLSLDHFLQRQRVISLWRSVVRALYKIPKAHRDEPMRYARNEFERNKDVSDLSQIRYLISTGKTEFGSMQRYIDELAAK